MARADWVARNLRMPSSALARLLDQHPAYMARLKRRAPLWLCHILHAWNEGWRPTRDWAASARPERRAILVAWSNLWSRTHAPGAMEFLWDFPAGRIGERWCDALAQDAPVEIPVRLALLADLIVQGYLDEGATFQ